MTFIYILIFIYYLAIIRSSLIVLGKSKKLYKAEKFTNYQILAALAVVALILSSVIFGSPWQITFAIINLLLVFLFYLQPTPRTTKTLLVIFALAQLIAVIFFVM